MSTGEEPARDDAARLDEIARTTPHLMRALRAARDVEAPDWLITAALRARAPELPWDVKNQATVHLWYPERFGVDVVAFACCADAVATFPETATCVGIRLLGDGTLHVVAPYGLGDLLGCVCRHNPARVSRSFFEARLAEKGWMRRWPQLRVVSP